MSHTNATEGQLCAAGCQRVDGQPAVAVHVVDRKPLCAYHSPYDVVNEAGQTSMDVYLAGFDARHAKTGTTVEEMLTRYLAGEVTKDELLNVAAKATSERRVAGTYRVAKRFNVRGDRYFLHADCDCRLNETLLGTFTTEAEAIASQSVKLTRCGRSN